MAILVMLLRIRDVFVRMRGNMRYTQKQSSGGVL